MVVRDQAVIEVNAVRWSYFNPVMPFQTMKYHLRFLQSTYSNPSPQGSNRRTDWWYRTVRLQDTEDLVTYSENPC